MLRLILTLLLASLITLPTTQANELNWNQLLGCYETVLLDGQAVQMGPEYERSLTMIESGTSSVFETLKGEALKHILITLFTGANGPWYGYHSFVVFPEMGTLNMSDRSLSYLIDEDVNYIDWGRATKVDHYLNVNIELVGELIKGSAHFESELRQLSGERTFTLKAAPCW